MNEKRTIRVIVADDSPVARDLLTEVLNSDSRLEVVGIAKDGEQAVDLVRRLKPDIITMDVQMPRMDGFEATKEIMIVEPTPIVIVSGNIGSPDVEKSMNAIRAGALTAIGKPPSPQSPEFEQAAGQLIDTVVSMASVKVIRHRRTRRQVDESKDSAAVRAIDTPLPAVVAIATSTGGPEALDKLLSELPVDFPLPILVVQHITTGFTHGFVSWLDQCVPLKVKEAVDGERVEPSVVYIAPEHGHLGFSASKRVQILDQPPVDGFRPSGTILFESAARVFGDATVAVVLTGMGSDGLNGLRSVRQVGGYVIAQDEQSSVLYGMPRVAAEAGLANIVLPLDTIAYYLVQLARRISNWTGGGRSGGKGKGDETDSAG